MADADECDRRRRDDDYPGNQYPEENDSLPVVDLLFAAVPLADGPVDCDLPQAARRLEDLQAETKASTGVSLVSQ